MSALSLLQDLKLRRGWEDDLLLMLVAGFADEQEAFWADPRRAGRLPVTFAEFLARAEAACLAALAPATEGCRPGTGPGPAPVIADVVPAPAEAPPPAPPGAVPGAAESAELVLDPGRHDELLLVLADRRLADPGRLGETVCALAAPFGGGLEAELRLRTGRPAQFVHPRLLRDGEPVEGASLPPRHGEVVGTYAFGYAGRTYTLTVRRGEAAGVEPGGADGGREQEGPGGAA